MHIVFLTPGFPQDEQETHCLTYLQNFIKELSETVDQVQISIITFHYPFTIGEYFWNNIKVYSIGGKNSKGLGKLLLWQKVNSTFKKIEQEKKVDVIHSFWLKECALVGNYLKRKYNILHFTTAMGTEVMRRANYYLYVLNLSKMKIVTTTTFQQEKLQVAFPNIDTTIIPFGISEEKKMDNKEERNIDILSVGSINSVKNIPLFIDIVQRLRQVSKKNIKAVIIGEDQCNGLLKKMIEEKNLKDYVLYLGSQSNDSVKAYMRKSKVLVHTSNFESQGYVFLEALQAGMQIVSRQVGMANKSEKWFIANDLNSFTEATQKALEVTNFESQRPYPIEETVAKYLELWNGNIEK